MRVLLDDRHRGQPGARARELLRRADMVAVHERHLVNYDHLVDYMRRHATGGRWTVSEPGTKKSPGGRPLGSGQFRGRAEALASLRAAHLAIAEDLRGWRDPTITDLAKKIGAKRQTVYWWFRRFDITMADLT